MLGNLLWKTPLGIICILLFGGVSTALATVPAEINYQGILEDPDGPATGSFTLFFRLFDTPTDGTPLWEEAQSVSVDQGIYNAILGRGTINPLYGNLEDTIVENDDLWLEIHVFGESDAMSPRQKLTSVGFAMRAGSVSDGAITTTMLAIDAVTTEKLVDGAVTAAKVTGGFVPDLDADKLDGLDATAFSQLDHSHGGSYYSQAHVDALEDRIAVLEAKLQYLTVVAGTVNQMPGPHVMITGANLHVTSGSGSTDGPINGLGNLIVGYNELQGSGDDRTGSHTIVVGREHNFSSYGGLVGGYQNTISGPYASVSGGHDNTASVYSSSVSGGRGNTASGWYSSVSGGSFNEASGNISSVSGGNGNTASGYRSSVSGGEANAASANVSSVSGGYGNTASGSSSSVSGGNENEASGDYTSVSGGRYNTASGNYASVSGGGGENASAGNEAFADYSAILGGRNNVTGDVSSSDHTIGPQSTVSGGYGNMASGQYASVSGGLSNTASGNRSSVSGGYTNTASGQYASVSGGANNTASIDYASVSGGSGNTASGSSSSVSGGSYNTASGLWSSVSGGQYRSVTGSSDWRAGGYFQDQ